MESKKEILSALFDKYRNELKDLNEYLYSNPELGLQEYKACTAHTNILKKYGFEVEKGFANLETAYKAPCYLVCGYNLDEVWRNDLDGDRESGDIDVSIVITHMMLMAEELGLGACWIGRITPELVKKNLDIPENVKVVAVLSLGYHREDDRPSKLHTIRRSNEELVKFL